MVAQKLDFAGLERLLDGVEATDAITRAALRRARRALRQQQPPSRPPMDDRAAVRQINEHMAQHGGSLHAAAMKVARELRPFAPNHKAIAERYRRKSKRYST